MRHPKRCSRRVVGGAELFLRDEVGGPDQGVGDLRWALHPGFSRLITPM